MRILNINNLGFFSRLKLAGRIVAASGVGYDASGPSRTRRGFGISPGIYSAADRHLDTTTLGRLRELCRMYDRQSPLFSGILDRAQDNIFGSNFDFVPVITGGDEKADSELTKKVKDYIWKRMDAVSCDVEGHDDFEDLAKKTLRAIWNDGDILWVKRPDGAVQVFEADQVESGSTGRNGRRVVLGVELDDFNRPAAYYVRKRNSGGTTAASQPFRVPAESAFFPGYRKRKNQTRGQPYLATILGFFERTDNYLDFESLAAEGNAMLGYQIIADAGGTASSAGYTVSGTEDNMDDSTKDTFEKVQKMEPFQVFDLSMTPGQKVEMIQAERPGQNFREYIVSCLRIIGVGVGLPLELIMLDFSQTNYSSARASLGEARRAFRGWQSFAAKKICLPWYNWQISRGIASGVFPADARIYNARCQWPAWEYIDPVKEADGNKIAVDLRTKSISECIRERGQEPDEVFDELAADFARLKDKGIPVADKNETTQIVRNRE